MYTLVFKLGKLHMLPNAPCINHIKQRFVNMELHTKVKNY